MFFGKIAFLIFYIRPTTNATCPSYTESANMGTKIALWVHKTVMPFLYTNKRINGAGNDGANRGSYWEAQVL